MSWDVVIGLEVHIQLQTHSKIFSGSSTSFGAEANAQASIIDLGLPGTLPVLNAKVVEMACKFGLAIDAHINQRSLFERKNYFYPDLPKGYQISQLQIPIIGEGQLEIQTSKGTKNIGITRAHLEEDAGKSVHEGFAYGASGIDLNRAGTPLLEIVSEPEITNAEEAVAYLKALHAIVTTLGICDGNMSQGSMRCDINLSLKPQGSKKLGTRTEIKNVNSFKFVEQAIYSEIDRQRDLLENGGTITQETRLFNPNTQQTKSMRSKEEANDYRYFPDPDLLPVVIEDSFLQQLKSTLPKLPKEKQREYEAQGIKARDAYLIAHNSSVGTFFTEMQAHATNKCSPELLQNFANWILSELQGLLNKDNLSIENSPIQAAQLADIALAVQANTISSKSGKQILAALWDLPQYSVKQYIEENNLAQVSDTGFIEDIILKIIADNPKQVAQYQAADDAKKKKLSGFFVGQAMKASQGKANPKIINQLLGKHLS